VTGPRRVRAAIVLGESTSIWGVEKSSIEG
jgi:hypothetical protein